MPGTEELNHRDRMSGAIDRGLPVIAASNMSRAAWPRIVPDAQRSCRDFGFLSIRLTEAQQRCVQRTLAAMRGFFGMPETDKQACRNGGQGHGWTPSYEEPAYQPGTIASVESFDLDRQFIASAGGQGWPTVTGFRDAAAACWDSWIALGNEVLELVARAAAMEPSFLQSACSSAELHTLRFLHYPEDSERVAEANVGIAAHTDFECITLLYQDTPGLEIRTPSGAWYEVPAEPDRLIVLLDDMLETWTNGRLVATGHRVRRTPAARHSIVLFIAADAGLRIAPLPEYVSEEHPARYPATEQARHIDAQMRRARSLADAPG